MAHQKLPVLGLLCLYCTLQLPPAVSIPLAQFYPFGGEAGDSELPSNDDGSAGPITLSSPFPFFGRAHTTLYVNNNGDISFDTSVGTFTPETFPLANNLQLIAPFWADVDTTVAGNVWYREASSERSLLQRARDEIRRALASQEDFQPTFLFIATWDHVGSYGDASTNPLTNTFQCILVSDGLRSFVSFLYADGLIQWTTGTASGGMGGFGGTEAHVGFNAGDGIRFAGVPGSQTPDIINIASTSNVGQNGVWLFRVDQEEIVIETCDANAPLRISPRLGNVLGGTAISISGPCFGPMDTITCTFEGPLPVAGVYISQLMAICVSPFFEVEGWKPLTVEIMSPRDDIYSRDTRFYAVSFENTADVMFSMASASERTPPSLHIQPNSRLVVAWNPNTLLPMMAPTSFLVNIALSQMDIQTGRWHHMQNLATNLPNTGEATVTIPSQIMGNTATVTNDIFPVSIEVVVGSVDGRRKRQVSLGNLIELRIALWSPVGYLFGSAALRAACEVWRRSQPRGIGNEINSRLPPCPRTMQQADENTGDIKFSKDTGFGNYLSRLFFHPGAASCYRQITFYESHMRSGQQCCYYRNGRLATDSPAGGSVDLVSPQISTREHFIADVLPAIACCRGLFSNCEAYYEHRPSDDGSRFDPPIPACIYGDPHIITLDGFKYTFNGLGEYVLIQTEDSRFTLQGRMEVPSGSDMPGGIQATVFTAIVAKEELSDTIQIQLTSDAQSLEMLMNGEFVDFSGLSEQEFSNVAVSDLGNDTLTATFSSGVYLKVREQNGIISVLLVSLPRDYRGQTRGLMGDYNGNMGNDLMPRGGGGALPLSSSLEDIHTIFGVTWIISRREDSLFTYGGNTSFLTFHNPTFIPTFSPSFSNPELEAEARAMCGEDNFCLFDVAATGNTDIGVTTLQGNVDFENIVNISLPVSCVPPCENGACVADNVCSCPMGYRGERCSESIFTECDVNPCEHGGTCRNRAGSYICTCLSGFSGLQCQDTSSFQHMEASHVLCALWAVLSMTL